jgi:formyl-CoA transferase
MKVIELAHMMAGPTAGLLLADMGADVIKVEKPKGGDDTRKLVPPVLKGEPASFMVLNRGKRGIALDIKSPEGKAALLKLLADADAVIENFRPGTMEKLGLGYEVLRRYNPKLIYCQITGFGNNGPYATRAGLDLIAQAMSGLMSLTGEGPGRPPIKAGVPVGDVTAGILAATGVLAAYVKQLRTGLGDYVDTSLLEATAIHTYWPSAIAFATGRAAQPMGSSHPIAAPYQALPTTDGWITIGCATQSLWFRLLEVIGDDNLKVDPRFVDNAARMGHLTELGDALSAHFRKRSTADWMTLLDHAGVPNGPVLDINQMHQDPQVRHRKMVMEVDHLVAGRMEALGCPIKFSGVSTATSRGAPVLGQHTIEVLEEHGFSPDEIEQLLYTGAAAQHRTKAEVPVA